MNDVKKELIKTAGDVTKIKQRMIVEVERSIEQPIVKRTNKLIPALITAIILIAIILIAPKLMQTETQQQTASVPQMDAKLYELEQIRQLAFAEGTFWEENVKKDVDAEYAQYIMMQIYAQDHDIEVTKKDLQQAKETYANYSIFTSDDTTQDLTLYDELQERILTAYAKHGYTKKDLTELYEQYTYPKLALQTKITASIAEQYSKFKDSTHHFLLTYFVQSHLIEKNEDFYYEIMDIYPFVEMRFGATTDTAVVLQVTEQAILYINPHAFKYDDEPSPYVRWAPRLPGWDFKVGDAIKVSYKSSYNIDEDNIPQYDQVYKNVTHVLQMEPLESHRSVRFEVERDTLQAYFNNFSWQPLTQKPVTSPHYVVTDGLHTYNGYLQADKQMVMWTYKDQSAQIRIDKATQLLLQIMD